MNDDVPALLRRARDAVLRLGSADLDIRDKGAAGSPPDLVTRADLLVDEIVADGLARITPGAALLSEERQWSGEPIADGYVLDPVDGTHNFAAALPLWAISLARIEAGRIHEAWLLEAAGSLWSARRGHGCVRDGIAQRVSTSPLDRTILSVGLSEAVLPLLQASHLFAGVRLFGSHTLSLAWAAGGLVAVHAGRGWPWDVAAGQLLVEEAGGRCCRFDGSERPLWRRDHGLYGAPHAVERCLDVLRGGSPFVPPGSGP